MNRIPILITPLPRNFVDLLVVVGVGGIEGDVPVEDAEGGEGGGGDGFEGVVREALVAWEVVVVVCSHFLFWFWGDFCFV